jgi:hypothetical protein
VCVCAGQIGVLTSLEVSKDNTDYTD